MVSSKDLTKTLDLIAAADKQCAHWSFGFALCIQKRKTMIGVYSAPRNNPQMPATQNGIAVSVG